MKNRKKALRLITALSFVLTTSCDSTHHSLSEERPFLSPESKSIQINEEGEKVITLTSPNKVESRDPEAQRLRELVNASIEERVAKKLLELAPEEVITFAPNPRVTIKNNGQIEATLELEFQNENSTVVFLSPQDRDFTFEFEQVSGFDKRKIRLQGLCLDEEETCSQIAIKTHYNNGKTRVTEKFIRTTDLSETLVQEVTNETEEQNTPTINDSGETDLITLEEESGSADSNPLGNNDINFEGYENTEPQEDQTVDFNISTHTDQPINIQQPVLHQPSDGDSSPFVDTTPAEEPLNHNLSQPPPSDPVPNVDRSSELIEIQSQPLNGDEAWTTPPSLSATVQGEEVDVNITNVENTSLNQTPPQLAEISDDYDPSPSVDSETFTVKADEEDSHNGHDHSGENDSVQVAPSSVVFPDLEDEDPEVTEEFNINTAQTTPIAADEDSIEDMFDIDGDQNEDENTDSSLRPQARPESLLNDNRKAALLEEIQNKTYNQSRGAYNSDPVKGRLKNAVLLEEEMLGAVVNPIRRSRQYSSGILKSILTYAGIQMASKYSGSPICIHELSAEIGGRLRADRDKGLSGHVSHRNGLDADVSFPSSANACSTNVFPKWTELNKEDPDLMEKNWFFINALIETQRIHAILTDGDFIKSMCFYAKQNTGLSRNERNKIFKKLHHVSGHSDHYHIRVQCNSQNVGCAPQGVLRGSTCN